MQEKFFRHFEPYPLDGNVTTKGLGTVFRRFAQRLRPIYPIVSNTSGVLTAHVSKQQIDNVEETTYQWEFIHSPIILFSVVARIGFTFTIDFQNANSSDGDHDK